jgi:hypothetical protein
MKLRSIQQLTWTNLENISESLSPIQIKTMGSFLTNGGTGIVICPKCSEINLVRDSELQCNCGFQANIIYCGCGCGQTLLDIDRRGRPHKYLDGHGKRGKDNPSWNGGRKRDQRGYWLILKPEHHETPIGGYVMEHRIIYEEYHGCCLLPWSCIHHLDGDKGNNNINNLILTSKWEHHKKFHRQDFGQICERCYSTNIGRGFDKNGKRIFKCINCRSCWTINKERGISYNQTCHKCNSRNIIRCSGIRNNKQRFRCKDCRKYKSVPISYLMVEKSVNELRYEEHLNRVGDKLNRESIRRSI